MIQNDYRLKQRPEIIIGYCEECGGEVYLNNAYYKTNKGKVHEDCFDDFAHGFLDAELVEGFEGVVPYE